MPRWFCGIWPMLGSASEMILITSAERDVGDAAPPCSRGTLMPQRPLCEKRSISACGRVRFRSRSAAPRANSAASSLATAIASASSRMTWARAGRWSAERGARGPALAGISAREIAVMVGLVR